MARGYYDFSEFLKKHFDYKVQKIAINAGFTCPNRDGKKGVGGCTYCNNQTFNPEYCSDNLTVTQQLERGKSFFAKKYAQMKYLAYFQAYTNTYADVQYLKELYTEALAVEGVVGIIIGTRPDCMSQELLEYLQELSNSYFVLVEYGVESSNNDTLRIINRGHSWEDTVDAVMRTTGHGIMCGVHIILGLPGEGREQIVETARKLSALPIVTAKLHQLQLIKGTRMAAQVANGELEIERWSAEEYIEVCMDFIRNLSPEIAIERFVSQSPEQLLISPRWGLKNYQFTNLLNNRIAALDIHQGSEL